MANQSHIVAELSMSPMDKGVDLGPHVARVLDIIDSSSVDYELHAMGTVLEGGWSEVMDLIEQCHKALEEDCSRISTYIKIDYHAGKENQISGKVKSVEDNLGRQLNTGRSR